MTCTWVAYVNLNNKNKNDDDDDDDIQNSDGRRDSLDSVANCMVVRSSSVMWTPGLSLVLLMN